MSKENRKTFGFKHGFIVYLCILGGVGVGLLIALWGAMAKYQKGIDEAAKTAQHEIEVQRAPQLFFEEYVNSMTSDDWADAWFNSNVDSLDSRDNVQQEMNTIFGNNTLGRYKAESYSTETPVFVIANENEELAEFTLKGSDLNWEVDSIKVMVGAERSAEIEVLAGSKVLCNGVELDEKYIVDEHVYFMINDYKESLVNPVKWYTYRVEGQLSEPVLEYELPEGSNVVSDENGRLYYVVDDKTTEDIKKKADEFVHAMLYFYMQGKTNTVANMNKTLKLVVPDSVAYGLISNSGRSVRWRSTVNDAVYKVQPTNVIKWADNCYTVDVDYSAKGASTNFTEMADGSYRVFFLDMGSGFGIYGFALN